MRQHHPLRQFLEAHEVSQNQLASEIGMDKSNLSRKVNGDRSFMQRDIDAILAWARTIDSTVTYEQLFGAESEAA